MGDGQRRYGLGLRRDGHLVLVTVLTMLMLTIAAYGAWEIAWVARWLSFVAAQQAGLAARQAERVALYKHPGRYPKLDRFIYHGMVYPPIGLRKGEQGAVLLNLLILPDGTVGDAAVAHSSGSTQLDAAAITQVGYWHFVPASENGHWVSRRKLFRIVFRLEGSPAPLPIGRANLPAAGP